MDITAYKASVDAAITDKTAPNTINPEDVGNKIKELADLAGAELSNINEALFKEETDTIGFSDFNAVQRVGSGRVYVNVDYSRINGLAKKIKISVAKPDNYVLIHFRNNGANYLNIASHIINVPVDTPTEIDLSALGINVLTTDTFGIVSPNWDAVNGAKSVRTVTNAAYSQLSYSADGAGVYVIPSNAILTPGAPNGIGVCFDIYIEKSISALNDINSKIDEIETQAIPTVALSVEEVKAAVFSKKNTTLQEIAKKDDIGWNLDTFSGWAFGLVPAKPEIITSVLFNVSRIPNNEKLTLRIFSRPLSFVDSDLRPGAATGDVLLKTVDYPVALFQNIPGFQEISLPFDALQVDESKIFLFEVKAWKANAVVGDLGSDRSPIVGVTKQYDRGWYFQDDGTKGNIPGTYTVVRTVYKQIEVNNINAIEVNVSGNSKDIADLKSRVPISRITRGTVLFNEKLTAISANWTNNGWVPVAGGISPTIIGLTGFIRLDKQYSLDRRAAKTIVRLGATTRFLLHTMNSEGNVNLCTMSECDASAGQLRIYKGYDSAATVLPAVSVSLPYSFLTDRDYIVELTLNKNLFSHTLKVTDTITGIVTSLEDTTKTAGRQHDAYAMTCYSGVAPIVKSFTVTTPVKSPFLIALGDSITEAMGNGVLAVNGYAQALVSAVNGDGAVSGRGGGNLDGVLRRIETEIQFIKPVYCVVMIGTNNGNTLAKLRQLVTRVKELGCIVVLNNIPTRDVSVVARNADIATVRTEFGLSGALMDVATSIGNDPASGQNVALFYGDLVHPIDFGNPFMFNRFKLDVPELLI